MAARKKGAMGGWRPGAGRKPKPREERRRNRVVMNLSDLELEAIERVIGGRSVADFARDLMLRYVARRR